MKTTKKTIELNKKFSQLNEKEMVFVNGGLCGDEEEGGSRDNRRRDGTGVDFDEHIVYA